MCKMYWDLLSEDIICKHVINEKLPEKIKWCALCSLEGGGGPFYRGGLLKIFVAHVFKHFITESTFFLCIYKLER